MLFSSASLCVPVLLPVSLERVFSYEIPPEMVVKKGDFVRVPLGQRHLIGVVWGVPQSARDVDFDVSKLKAVREVLSILALKEDFCHFIDWVSTWTLMPAGMVLRMVLQKEEWMMPPEDVPAYMLDQSVLEEGVKLTPQRQKVIDYLLDLKKETQSGGEEVPRALPKSILAKKADVSPSVIEGLYKKDLLQKTSISEDESLFFDPPSHIKQEAVTLSAMQQEAADRLIQNGENGRNTARKAQVSLLRGLTGSGKTQVYFEVVEAALKQGQQVLIMMPEIALTHSVLKRFEKRFGFRPDEWHSNFLGKQRGRVWRSCASGKARVVIGARSALFLPFSNLGLIIIDEEHETAYKQEDRVFYNARDMAIVRGQIENIPVILTSATPSLETYYNVDCGRYDEVFLPARYNKAVLPAVETIDLRADVPEQGHWLSDPLVEQVSETLKRGEQALLYLNRRGYAPLTLCRACGERVQCPSCSAWLVEHRLRNKLMCHHCGYCEPVPNSCPSCGAEGKLVACGPGVERIAEEALMRFQGAKICVLSSDMEGGITQLRADIKAIERGEVDLIIGTQLVAKGHHFPDLTCVGIVDGDLGFGGVDPRASERSFQLLAQVTGRAGRGAKEGHAFIQTHMPDHPALKALMAHDHEGFYKQELLARERAHLPPFSRLAALIISAGEFQQAFDYARLMLSHVPHHSSVLILGPAEAPMAVIRGRYRVRLLIRGPRGRLLNVFLKDWLKKAPQPKGSVRVQIDVDPQSFY